METNISIYKKVLTIVRKSGVGTLAPKEFVELINLAQMEVVNNKLALVGTGIRTNDDLLPLHDVQVVSMTKNGDTYDGNLPNEFMRYTDVELTLTYNLVDYPHVPCYLLHDNQRQTVLNSVYKRPSVRKCYFSFEVGKMKLYLPSSATPSVKLSFYKKPVDIVIDANVTSVNLVWNASMVNEIANRCAAMYIESIKDERFQSLNAEQSKNNTKN